MKDIEQKAREYIKNQQNYFEIDGVYIMQPPDLSEFLASFAEQYHAEQSEQHRKERTALIDKWEKELKEYQSVSNKSESELGRVVQIKDSINDLKQIMK